MSDVNIFVLKSTCVCVWCVFGVCLVCVRVCVCLMRNLRDSDEFCKAFDHP